MGKPGFRYEFKRDAVAQITERGHPVAKVSQRQPATASRFGYARDATRLHFIPISRGTDIPNAPLQHSLVVKTCHRPS